SVIVDPLLYGYIPIALYSSMSIAAFQPWSAYGRGLPYWSASKLMASPSSDLRFFPSFPCSAWISNKVRRTWGGKCAPISTVPLAAVGRSFALVGIAAETDAAGAAFAMALSPAASAVGFFMVCGSRF